MKRQRRVKLLRIGRSQAVCIPSEFELPGKQAIRRKEGTRLVIEPVCAPSSLLEYLATLRPHDFPDIEDRPPEPVDI